MARKDDSFTDTEIDKCRAAVFADEDVVRFQVEVQVTRTVNMVQRLGDL